jgi:hypothetical protein
MQRYFMPLNRSENSFGFFASAAGEFAARADVRLNSARQETATTSGKRTRRITAGPSGKEARKTA